MDRATFEAALTREGFEIVTNTMKPDAVNAEHAHGFDARLMVVAGAMTILRDGAATRTYQMGETFEIPSGCRHSETAGAAGATYVAGRRAPSQHLRGTPVDRLVFEADLRRDGYRVVNGSLRPNLIDPDHIHDFDAKIMVLGGQITITREGKPETFRAGDSCAVPAGCTHAEQVGPEGVAYVSGRRRNGPLTREAFEADLRREGFEVIHGGQNAGHTADTHAHDFDARIMVLSGEITLTRDGKPETFRAGDHCEVPAGCMHAEKVGPEGVAYIAGKVCRQIAA